MRVRREVLVVLCVGVAFGGAHMARAQEATSASLPDQFQTGEMASTSKPKKTKAEPSSQTLAPASKRSTAPVTEAEPSDGRAANTDSNRRENSRTPHAKRRDGTKSEANECDRRTTSCGGFAYDGRTSRKETAPKKAAASCNSTRAGQFPGHRADVAFGCAIHGNQGSATSVSVRSEAPRR